MIESNFLKEFRIATTFLQNLKDFQAKLEYLKKVIVHPDHEKFSKIHLVIHLRHPQTLLGSSFLSGGEKGRAYIAKSAFGEG